MEQVQSEQYPVDGAFSYTPAEEIYFMPVKEAPWVGDTVRPVVKVVISTYGPEREGENYEEIRVVDWSDRADVYTLSNDYSAWCATVMPEEIELVSRGNFWKKENGELVQFESLEDEIALHKTIGAYATVEQADGESWTLDSLLDAIAEGKVDSFSTGNNIALTAERVSQPVLTAVYFRDRGLGQRVANTTLTGFQREPREAIK